MLGLIAVALAVWLILGLFLAVRFGRAAAASTEEKPVRTEAKVMETRILPIHRAVITSCSRFDRSGMGACPAEVDA